MENAKPEAAEFWFRRMNEECPTWAIGVPVLFAILVLALVVIFRPDKKLIAALVGSMVVGVISIIYLPLAFLLVTRTTFSWTVILFPVLGVAMFYVVLMYIRDARSVHFMWAVFLGLLRTTVYLILAVVFMLPGCQYSDKQEYESKMIILFDVSDSMLEKDDLLELGVDRNTQLSRQDKIWRFMTDAKGAAGEEKSPFLDRVVDKSPLLAGRFGSVLDDIDLINLHAKKQKSLPAEDWRKWLNPDKKDILPPDVANLKDEDPKKKQLLDQYAKRQANVVTLRGGTNIGGAALAMHKLENSSYIQAIIIVSDGQSNVGSDDARVQFLDRVNNSKRVIPVITIGVGQFRLPVKIRIDDLNAPEETRPDDPFRVKVPVVSTGIPGEDFEVTIEVQRVENKEGKPVAGKAFTLPTGDDKANKKNLGKGKFKGAGDQQQGIVDFEVNVQALTGIKSETDTAGLLEGKWLIKAKTKRHDKENTTEEFHESEPIYVQIQKRKLRVLLFAGGATREYQFLRTVLSREMTEQRMEFCILNQATGDADHVDQDVEPDRMLEDFPDRLGPNAAGKRFRSLSDYDVIVAFDPDWTKLSEKQSKLLYDWVSIHGGGIIFVAGPVYTHQIARPSGAKIDSILSLYPCVLNDSRTHGLGLQGQHDPTRPHPLIFNPATKALPDFVKLDEESDNPTAGWKTFFWGREGYMPGPDERPKKGFFTYYPVNRIKPNSFTIAAFGAKEARIGDKTEAFKDQQPFIVSMQPGNGKSLYIGSGEFWRLRAVRDRDGKEAGFHERLWIKMFRYVSAGAKERKKYGRLVMPRIANIGRIEVDAQINGKDLQPLDATVVPTVLVRRIEKKNRDGGAPDPKDKDKEKDKEKKEVKGEKKDVNLKFDLKTTPLREGETWQGNFYGSIILTEDGDYEFRVPIPGVEGEYLRQTLVVRKPNPELDNLRTNFGYLHQLASPSDTLLRKEGISPETKKRIEALLVPPEGALPGAGDKNAKRLYFSLATADAITDCLVRVPPKTDTVKGRFVDLWDKPISNEWPDWLFWTLLIAPVVIGLILAVTLLIMGNWQGALLGYGICQFVGSLPLLIVFGTGLSVPLLWGPYAYAKITNTTGNGAPIEITSAAHRLATGDQVTVASVLGNTAANGTFKVTVINDDRFMLDDATGNGAYITSDGTFHRWSFPGAIIVGPLLVGLLGAGILLIARQWVGALAFFGACVGILLLGWLFCYFPIVALVIVGVLCGAGVGAYTIVLAIQKEILGTLIFFGTFAVLGGLALLGYFLYLDAHTLRFAASLREDNLRVGFSIVLIAAVTLVGVEWLTRKLLRPANDPLGEMVMATVTQPKKFNHDESQRRVRHPLQLLRTYIRRYIILEGVALTLLCAALLFWVGLVFDYGLMLFDFDAIGVYGIDWVLELNEMDTSGIASLGVRIIALTVIAVALVALGFSKVVWRWIREFNDKALALVLERRFKKQLGDRLITAVELHDPKLAQKYGYSQAMVEKTIMEAVEILRKLPVGSVFNWKRLVALWFLLGVTTVGIFLFLMAGFCLGSVVVELTRGRPNEGAIAWAGVSLTPTDAKTQTKSGLTEKDGLTVVSVEVNSAADKAGLRAQDVLVQINGKSVPSNMDDCMELLNDHQDGQAVDFVVSRNGKEDAVKGAKLPADAQRLGAVQPESALLSPWGFAWRFYDVAAIWTERNLFMMSTYWPRRAHVEIESFQPSKLDKNDMRVPVAEKERPQLRVRAYEWVIADRKAPRGWRALKWKDLAEHKLIDQDLLDRVKIPVDFNDWALDTDELEPNLVEALFGDKKTGRTSGEVRAQLEQPASKGKIEARGDEVKQTLKEWLDWPEWTVDKISLQEKNTDVRTPMRAEMEKHGCTHDDLEAVFDKLDELVKSPWYSRTVRKLKVPRSVDIKFRGENETTREPAVPVRRDTNKYNVELESLKGSSHYKFRVRGDNYFTPLKSITLVTAPTAATISTDTEEPAYIYHRLPFKRERIEIDDPDALGKDKKEKTFKEIVVDDQMPLQGKHHVVKDVSRPTTGVFNTIEVMLGSDLVIHVAIDNSPVVWGDVSLSKVRPSLRDRLGLPEGEGVLVAAVTEKSPLEEAGLRVGDIVVKINGDPAPSNLEKLVELIAKPRAAQPIGFSVLAAANKYEKAALQVAALPDHAKYTPRKLRGDKAVITSNPAVMEPGAEGFDRLGRVKINADMLGFSLEMDKIKGNHHFKVEFYDEDKIRGERFFKVMRTLDADPSVGNLSVFDYTPRVPRYKAAAVDSDVPIDKDKDKDPDAIEPTKEQLELTKAFLITADANIPLECRVTDDYGLVRVGYHFKYRKIDFELIANPGSKKASTIQINETTRRKHGNLVGNNFLAFTGYPLSWYAPSLSAKITEEIQYDVHTAQGYREGFISSPAFEDLLERKLKSGEMTPLDKLDKLLAGPRRARPWEFDCRDDRGFDLRQHLKELKAVDPKLGQLHYHLQIAVQATDNNVETGAPQFIEVYEDGGAGKQVKKTVLQRGNTKKNGNGYLNFVIITENELLAQIALEEELLYDKLVAAKKKIDDGMISLQEQRIKISAGDGKPDLDAIVARMNLIRTALLTAGNNLRDSHLAYENIIKELVVNRVKNQRKKKIEDDITDPLVRIVVGDGSYPTADKAFADAHELVEKDYNEKRDPDVALHHRRMGQAYNDMDRLSKEIQTVLNAMSEGMLESTLIAMMATMEREQRAISKFFRDKYGEELKHITDGLTDPKKEQKKDPKPQSQLRAAPVDCVLVLAEPAPLGDPSAVSWRFSRLVESAREPVISRIVPRFEAAQQPAHAAGRRRTPKFNL